MANKKIQVTELDFDGIKQSLKTYLEGQAEFSDYNFEGSGLSILLDLLTVNTHYNSLYLNLAVNEAFLDSGSKRSSVVSKAKELGYVPRSSRSTTAKVNVTAINEQVDAPSFLELPSYTPFVTLIDSKTYTFYNISPYIAYKSGTTYLFTDVELKEGTLLTYKYTVANGARYILPNTKIDTSTIKVTVQENSQSSTYEIFNETNSIINIDGTSAVYFLKENYDGLYELEFGNDIIGKALSNGNVITVTYLICNESEPNGANSFSVNTTIAPNTTTYVTTTDSGYGGSAPESVDSIKWNAPRAYTTQNRCITVDDYKSIIKSMYTVTDVNVWGGEINNPPQYGKVFISIVPSNKEFLDSDDKDYILNNIINPRKSLSITPEFVDPSYLKLKLDVVFKYDPNLTIRTSNELASLVLQTIMDYKTEKLSTFDGVFRQSRLSADIDNCEDAMISNTIDFEIHREIEPVYNIVSGYDIMIGNPIYKSVDASESVISTGFYIPDSTNVHYIDDEPDSVSNTGVLRLFYKDTNGVKVIVSNIGTVNYDTGAIVINNLTLTSLYQSEFKFIIKPDLNDIYSNRNQFVTIEESMITITPALDNE